MDEKQTLTIRGEFDVIVARSRVRDLARRVGMNTTDQACISLATSSTARALGLGGSHTGQIVIEGVSDGERSGVQVTCKARQNGNGHSSRPLTDARLMTDDLTVETLPSDEVHVTLVKWAK